ncbi:glycosyltransferase [Arthrobacter sp. NicSoilB11]|uniref:glycosyltransferase n=1 Tax=Arthrobacter sp. NicSoilB11 TaxID=2830999 RepID=UPI001CC3847E|nr:glycosyltransferase [Arthrobacter sp. NicSoilB11]BCW76822.1 glycosyl transferase [Arthrobacter sp. NicSoilB11]
MENFSLNQQLNGFPTSTNVVVLSTADFNSPVWTNKQHMAVGLAEAGYNVFYVESLGLRAPTFTRADISRVLRHALKLIRRRMKKSDARQQPASQPNNLVLIAPTVLPFHGLRIVRKINAALIRRLRRDHLPSDGNYILWTFSPITYGLESGSKGVVYHSVDLLHTIPGVPTKALRDAESALMIAADVVVASSKGVEDHLKILDSAKKVLLWENVASTDLFAASMSNSVPRAIFAGNVTPTKVDVHMLRGLVEAGVPLAIAGPMGIDGSTGDLELKKLVESPGVEYLGNLALADLAREVGRSQVGLIPYLRNDYTSGVFPMKVYEYLAAGLEVVSTDIPSLSEKSIEGLHVVTANHFVETVTRSLATFTEEGARKRSLDARSNSWDNRIKDATAILHGFRRKQ